MAEMLGVLSIGLYGVLKDYNGATNPGTYRIKGKLDSGNNPPFVALNYGILTVDKSEDVIMQTARNLVNETYSRFYSDNAWSNWQRIDNFGYNSLAELAGGVANQVNPMMFKGDKIDLDTDLNSNEFLQTGWYVLDGDSTNSPVSNGLILLEVFNSMNESSGGKSISVVQKVTTLSTGIPNHYMRTKWGAWNDWKQIG